MKNMSSALRFGVFGLDILSAGKESIVDQRLDTVKEMVRSQKRTYIQVEVIDDFERFRECTGIILTGDKKTDLIIADLDFVEKRLVNTNEEKERNLLNRFREQLEREQFIFELDLEGEDLDTAAGYSLLSLKPVFLIELDGSKDKSEIISSAHNKFGYITFFTANDKEARAWSIKKGHTCWQASGLIHSDIQEGFIRAEVISFNDLIHDAGINQARMNNHLRLENKDYVVQDGDLIKFRFNK